MVYLDYNASTPIDPRVVEGICESLRHDFGNPSSRQHRSGQIAAESLEMARHRVASALDAPARDVVFTSGATEAISLGIGGSLMARGAERPNVVVGATEHKAVLNAARSVIRLTGGELRIAPVASDGKLDLSGLEGLVDESVAIVAVMAANNETGVLADLVSVARIAHDFNAWFFCDATQLFGKGAFSFARSQADLVSISSHKAYGPKGAGALVAGRLIRRAVVPLVPGGGQEGGLRGGTENVASIHGFGKAAEIVSKESEGDEQRSAHLVDRLLSGLSERVGTLSITGSEDRLTNTVNVRFPGADAEAIMVRARTVEVSGGSACQSSVPSPSHVLSAMGLSRAEAEECVRVSVGRFTTEHEIDLAVDSIAEAVLDVRKLTLKGSSW